MAYIDKIDPSKAEGRLVVSYGRITLKDEHAPRSDVPLDRKSDLLFQYLKEKGLKLRLNTNGLSDLLNKKPTAKELCKYFDTISISLNAPTAEKYNELCNPSFGEKSFDALLQFARDCKETGVNLKFSLVDVIPKEDIAACQVLSDRMGIPLRVREYVAD